jgi:hypothetical protein
MIDKTNRGYISGFELDNMMELNIEQYIYLLDFIKESLNGIIDLDNKINS